MRQKSPNVTNAGGQSSYRSRLAHQQDDNIARMRQSCERIATVLGLREGGGAAAPVDRSSVIHDSNSPVRRE